jgi:hypothetical protein
LFDFLRGCGPGYPQGLIIILEFYRHGESRKEPAG